MDLLKYDEGLNMQNKPLEKESFGAINPYLLIILALLILGRRHGGVRGVETNTAIDIIKNAIRHPELDKVLSSVCVHLNEEDQGPIHTLGGILQSVNTIKRLQENTYKIQAAPSVQLNHRDRHKGIVTLLKDYANEEDKSLLEAIESSLIALEKMGRVMNTQGKARENKEKNKEVEIIEA